MILRSIKIQNFLIILLTEVIRYKYTHIKMYAFIYAIYYAFFLLLLLFCAFCFVQLISCTFNKTSKFNSPHLMRPCLCQNHTYVPMRMLFSFKSGWKYGFSLVSVNHLLMCPKNDVFYQLKIWSTTTIQMAYSKHTTYIYPNVNWNGVYSRCEWMFTTRPLIHALFDISHQIVCMCDETDWVEP